MMRKTWVKAISSVAITFLLCVVYVWANNMSDSEKNIELRIFSEKTDYIILYNGVSVYDEFDGSPVTLTIPVNQWALNGENSISILVDVGDKENLKSSLKSKKLLVSLVVIDGRGKEEHEITRFDLAFSESKPMEIGANSYGGYSLQSKSNYTKSETGDVVVGDWHREDPEEEWAKLEQSIVINLDKPKWQYAEAEDLGDDQNLSDEEYYALVSELYLEHKKIWSLMKHKKKDELVALFKLRADEFGKAYYLAPGVKLAEMEQSLDSAFNHKDLYLDELVPEDRLSMRIEAGGKLARLFVAGTGEAPIYYSHPRGSFTRFYKFYFMKKDGKWSVIR